MIIKK
jgi:hypothetical protein